MRIAEGAYAVAEMLLQDLHQSATTAGRNGSLIEILILQAVTYAGQQQREQAFAVLAQALNLAGNPMGAAGYIRLFVDEGEALRLLLVDYRAQRVEVRLRAYLDRLLAAFDLPAPTSAVPLVRETPPIANQPAASRTLVEPLSERELEVLQLVAAGLSNSQIAAQLIVTTGTIKTHINHIFGKLAAQSRTQAVARARLLGLVTD